MKYVRTTDSSFPIAYERDKPKGDSFVTFSDGTISNIQDEDVVCLGHSVCSRFYIRKQHIIKESDNVEDLFDEYVLESKDNAYHSLLAKADPYDERTFSESYTENVKNGWRDYCSDYLRKGFKIYGAIYVRGKYGEPILKPFAKMKKERDWELL